MLTACCDCDGGRVDDDVGGGSGFFVDCGGVVGC